MSNVNLFRRLGAVLTVVGSSIRVAGAVEANRRPGRRDLERLGIDPRAFLSIGHG